MVNIQSAESKPEFRLLKLVMARHYSEATIDTAMGLLALTEKRTALAEELLEYLADEAHTEREFARLLSDKIKAMEAQTNSR